MRVAIVTESFLPTINGVSGSVARVSEQLHARGHDVLIVGPGPGPARFGDITVVRTPSVPLPGYQAIPVGRPTADTFHDLAAFRPDVIHVAGPVALGAWALSVARRMGTPSVAVYQTDFPRFARHYKVAAAENLAWRWTRHLHSMAHRTLAPSRSAAWDLRRHGVPRVALWGRGVDSTHFHPTKRSAQIRRALGAGRDDGDCLLIGYVGRLAPEKNVGLLRALRGTPGARLVVVGDGPDREKLARQLPDAVFTGYKGGVELARIYASLDLFVHTGAHETFCQTIQEALASGVPAIAPAIGGPLDLVRHNHNGLLYRAGDGRSLRRVVARLVHDADQRVRLALAARPGVAHRTWSTLTDELVGHYEAVVAPSVLQEHPRPRAAVG
ncbi:glycosyltransferase family 4 protein [Euzebya tangerina]|uniref:glycosyltransferase family 4 protein n=1 Tax=Euzebya tangerina TaxID=591198 RepID=UPI000E31B7DD|nr:glycosyltransferase family 1 protein [Euzebya tangerina]